LDGEFMAREFSVGVTFRNFAALAKLKGWTAESLAQEFPGVNSPESSVAYFTRILHGRPRLRCGDSVPAHYRDVSARSQTAHRQQQAVLL
jgi:hypothetical protein